MNIDGVENIVLSYFHLKDSDYVLYTINDGNYEVYLSRVTYLPKAIYLEKISPKKSADLKKLLNNLLGKEQDNAYFKAIGYTLLSTDQLSANKVSKKDCKILQLTKEQYQTLCKNSNIKDRDSSSVSGILIFLFFMVLVLLLYIFFLF